MMRLVAPLILLLPACSLTPVYSGGAPGPVATMLADTDVAEIPERSGFLVRQALLARVAGSGSARYRVVVSLDDTITGFGVRGDDSVSRERRTLRGRWQLVDTASGATLIDESVRADAGIDVVSSDYAVVAAENAALERLAVDLAEQIARRIMRHAMRQDQP
jgi:LPS-assembly lipoprotein